MEHTLSEEFHGYREIVMKYLEKKTSQEIFKFKESDFFLAFQQEKVTPNLQFLKKVLEEFCFRQGNQWLLKSGN